jgi:uncharacterized RDD family membrane protein YckC
MAPGAGSPASWWARFGARILDGLIIGIPLVIVSWIITAAFVDGGTRTCDEFGRCHVIDASGNAIIILWNLVEIILAIGYFGYLDGVKQQTIGKKLVGIKVVDSATGGPIGIGRSILRQIVLAITGAACFIGYFSPFFDGTKRMQGWHDKASNDFVVTAK